MNNLTIEKTRSTPYIHFDADSNVLRITGESFPENAAKFYAPVFAWLEEYLRTVGSQEITVEFEIIYFNSSTSKVFMTILDMLEKAVEEGKKVTVNWRCHEENETALECGEEFKEDLEKLPFHIVTIQGE